MANKEKTERSATIIPIGGVRTENGIKLLVVAGGTDEEVTREALTDYTMQVGGRSWTSQPIDERGNPTGKASVHFIGSKWNAPWEPTGPKFNGGYVPPEKADSQDPIN